jgi:hypothetical protein
VCVHTCRAVRRLNGTALAQYTTTGAILDAAWCRFAKPQRQLLCLLQVLALCTTLTVMGDQGQNFVVSDDAHVCAVSAATGCQSDGPHSSGRCAGGAAACDIPAAAPPARCGAAVGECCMLHLHVCAGGLSASPPSSTPEMVEVMDDYARSTMEGWSAALLGAKPLKHVARSCTWQGPGVEPQVLQHPLEELQPLAAHLGGGLPPGDWSSETVLWSSIELPLALTVNQVGAAAGAPADLTILRLSCTTWGHMHAELAQIGINVQRPHEQASNTCTVWRLGDCSVASGHQDTATMPAAPHTPATPPLPPLPPGSVPGSAARYLTHCAGTLQTSEAHKPPCGKSLRGPAVVSLSLTWLTLPARSIRLPDGGISPMAFSPHGFAAAASAAGGPASSPAAVQGARLSMQAVVLWQQQFAAGAAGLPGGGKPA